MNNKLKNSIVTISAIMLVIFIINFICEVWIWPEMTTGLDYIVPGILCIIVIASRSNIKKSTLIITIVSSVILIIESAYYFGSLFSIIYITLAIANMFLAISCLRKKTNL